MRIQIRKVYKRNLFRHISIYITNFIISFPHNTHQISSQWHNFTQNPSKNGVFWWLDGVFWWFYGDFLGHFWFFYLLKKDTPNMLLDRDILLGFFVKFLQKMTQKGQKKVILGHFFGLSLVLLSPIIRKVNDLFFENLT